MTVLIGDPDGQLTMCDTRTIVGFGSFVLNAPLTRHYPAKTVVRVFETGTDYPTPDPPSFNSERSNNPSNVAPITMPAVRMISRPLGPPLIAVNQSLFSPSILARQQQQQQPQTTQTANNNINSYSSSNTTAITDVDSTPLTLRSSPPTSAAVVPTAWALGRGLGVAATSRTKTNPFPPRPPFLSRRRRCVRMSWP